MISSGWRARQNCEQIVVQYLNITGWGMRRIAAVVGCFLAGVTPAIPASLCNGEIGARSISGGEPVRVEFRNRSDMAVTAAWIDYQGHRVAYQRIPPGGCASQDTYVGHPWVFVTDNSICKGIFFPNEGGGQYTVR